MSENKISDLTKELEQFQAEKEKIRMIVGQIGGRVTATNERVLNIVFILLLIALFILDIARHFFHIEIPVPPIFSVEIGLLLVSIKIIWMIHKQTKVEHFQFWILNSIEFRLEQMSHDVKALKKQLDSPEQDK